MVFSPIDSMTPVLTSSLVRNTMWCYATLPDKIFADVAGTFLPVVLNND